jgi:hypothetical protein
MSASRRSFLIAAPVMAVGFWRPDPSFGQSAPAPGPPAVPDSFPAQPPDLAREMVGVSHGNVARVKELLAARPTLSRASWDWGFGDWEDALGAASHVGHREIAELLIAHGARPTIFSAAMLGQLDVVKAFITAAPGVEATPGAHGITLLRHAMAGGERAAGVTDYLKTFPAADRRPAVQPLPPEELTALAGEYRFGSAPHERITIALTNGSLTFTRADRPPRGLAHVGDRAFFPVGAPLVRIRFRESSTGMTLTVHDPDVVLEAHRTR